MLYSRFAERLCGLSKEDINLAQKYVTTKMKEINIKERLSGWQPWQQLQRAQELRNFNFSALKIELVDGIQINRLLLFKWSQIWLLPETNDPCDLRAPCRQESLWKAKENNT